MDDFKLSLKDKHSFAREFTTVAMQCGLIGKSVDPASSTKHVASFYNTLVKELDKENKKDA